MLLDTTNGIEHVGRPHSLARLIPQDHELSTISEFRESYALTPKHSWYLPIKAGVEFALTIVILIMVSPVIAISALLIKLTSRGPVIFSQTRVGKDGTTYTIYKLRTMRHNCEAVSGPQWSKPGDTRITPVGRLLRVTHIDEFPQLWNVLRGEMGLVGPRPERPEFVSHLEREIRCYRNRLAVRPGITGLAQVHLPPDSDLASVRRKLTHDLYYVRRTNPWLDFRILICTVFTSIGLPFSWMSVIHRILKMPTEEAIERSYANSLTGSGEYETVSAPALEATA